jgi:hypothetical protein
MKWLPVPSVPKCARDRSAARDSFGVLAGDHAELRGQRRDRRPRQEGLRSTPGAAIVLAAAVGTSVRHRRLDRRSYAGEAVRQIRRRQIGHRRDHAAADIDADRRRHDRPLGGDHRAHCRALAPMRVRHHGQMLEQEGQAGDVAQLLLGLLLDRDAAGPRLDRRLVGFDDFV